MNAQLIFGAFVSSVISGFVPVVNGEVVAVTAAMLATPDAHGLLVAACVSGQMVAKLCLYGIARWSPKRLPERAQGAIARFEALSQRRGSLLIVLASAGVGMPPFYLVTIAAGALRLPVVLFAAAGIAGTLARYAVVVWGAARFTG